MANFVWMDLLSLVHQVGQIARQAGAAILEIYHHSTDWEVEQKADHSPLTIADRTSNELICRELQKLDPALPVVSEENKEIPFAQRSQYAYHWLVDPLDGTKEFIKRNGEFTVNIALIHQQRAVLGVVFIPCLDELYWGVQRQGAFLEKGSERQSLRAAPFNWTDPHLKVVCSRSHLNAETQAFIDQLDQPERVSKGSSLKFLILAQGEANLYPRLAPTMEWDTAAAQIILEEAGGKVIDQETRQPLRYNKENLRNPSFVAYGKLIE